MVRTTDRNPQYQAPQEIAVVVYTERDLEQWMGLMARYGVPCRTQVFMRDMHDEPSAWRIFLGVTNIQ